MLSHENIRDWFGSGFIEKQAEDPLPLGGGMNAVSTAIETWSEIYI